MSKREINIRIAAQNAMRAGLASAGASLKKFGESAKRIAGFFAKGFLAAGTAVAGFAAKALHAYAKQESAERSVIAAMNAHGEAGEALLPMYRRIANAIQDETGVADENTLASMANMRMLGVRTDQMEKAAKGLIGLKSAGMDGATAERALAAAMQGNYSMLTRYIPALRDATDATEKQRIVNEFMAKGYEHQKGQLDTVAGQWNALKGRVSDVWEEFGRVIAQNDMVVGALKKMQDAVVKFGEKVKEWTEGGGLQNLVAGFQHFGNEVAHIWNHYIRSPYEITMAILRDATETAITYIANYFKNMANGIQMHFRHIGEYAKAAWELVKNPGREAFRALTSLSEQHRDERIQHAKDTAAAIIGADALVTERTKKALEDRARREESYQKRAADVTKKHAENLIAHREKVKQSAIDAAKAEADAMAAAQSAAASDIVDVHGQLTSDIKLEQDNRVQNEKDTLDTIVDMHRDAASEAAAIWRGVGEFDPKKGTKRVGGVKGTLRLGGDMAGPLAYASNPLPTGSHRVSMGGMSPFGAPGAGIKTGWFDRGLAAAVGKPMNEWGRTNNDILRELQMMNRNQNALLRAR